MAVVVREASAEIPSQTECRGTKRKEAPNGTGLCRSKRARKSESISSLVTQKKIEKIREINWTFGQLQDGFLEVPPGSEIHTWIHKKLWMDYFFEQCNFLAERLEDRTIAQIRIPKFLKLAEIIDLSDEAQETLTESLELLWGVEKSKGTKDFKIAYRIAFFCKQIIGVEEFDKQIKNEEPDFDQDPHFSLYKLRSFKKMIQSLDALSLL